MHITDDELLLNNIKLNINEILDLHKDFTRSEEDLIYRFYHQSFKVFGVINLIAKARILFDKIALEGWHLNDWYCQIVAEALSKEFNSNSNSIWIAETRPIIEAFWHSKYFLDQLITSSANLDHAPQMLPSGWAAILHLYNIR